MTNGGTERHIRHEAPHFHGRNDHGSRTVQRSVEPGRLDLHFSRGHQYRASLNPDGVALVSLYPVARFTGTGAMTQVITEIETLYLGRDCDAFSKVLGRGVWTWANGGFGADFRDRKIWFPRQEIDANNGLNCQFR